MSKPEVQKLWRARNRDHLRAQDSARNAEKKREVRAYVRAAKSRPCMDCGGVFDPICMDFDHRPGEVKLYNVAQLNSSIPAVKREIAKCDLVCANCHRLRTASRARSKAVGETASRQLSLLDEAT